MIYLSVNVGAMVYIEEKGKSKSDNISIPIAGDKLNMTIPIDADEHGGQTKLRELLVEIEKLCRSFQAKTPV